MLAESKTLTSSTLADFCRYGIAATRRYLPDQPLLQLRILRFGLLEDRDVGVGVFPEGEEI